MVLFSYMLYFSLWCRGTEQEFEDICYLYTCSKVNCYCHVCCHFLFVYF